MCSRSPTRRVIVQIALLAALLPALSWAQSMAQLLADDHVRVNAWVVPAENIVPGQQVSVVVELATDTWFGAGTRFTLPEVADAIVLRREKFATNLTRREDGRDWTAQRFELTVYPQFAGEYRVPPVRLEATVAGDSGKRIAGTVMTPAVSFEAVIPAALGGDKQWIASPDLTVEQRFDRDTTGLRPGDAVVRTITMRAEDLPAMMLAPPPTAEHEGLGTYPRTPQLHDRVDRGSYRAERIDVTTFMIEAPGQYALPEQRYVWWNTATGERSELLLPAVTLDAGAAVVDAAEGGDVQPAMASSQRWLPIAVVVGLALLSGLVLSRWKRGDPADSHANRTLTSAEFRRRYRAALKAGDLPAASATLYAWYDADARAFDGVLVPYIRSHHGRPGADAFADMLQQVYSRAASAGAGMDALASLEPPSAAADETGEAVLPVDHDLRLRGGGQSLDT